MDLDTTIINAKLNEDFLMNSISSICSIDVDDKVTFIVVNISNIRNIKILQICIRYTISTGFFVAKHTTKRSGGPFLVDSLITLQCPDFRIRPAR